MTIYYAETSMGCVLESASSAEEAKKVIACDCGENNITKIRKATKQDVEWVRMMGGYVPRAKERNNEY